MPMFQFDIEKKAVAGAHTGEYWTNRYLCMAGTLEEARIFAVQVKDVEIALHTAAVLFTKVAVRDTTPSDVYVTVPVNAPGNYAGGSVPTDLLPAMLVMRVDLGAVAGRPSRKYYHLMLGENFQTNGQWTSSVLSDVTSTLTTLITSTASVGQLCDPDGQTLISAAALPTVTVHQFRRGSRRRTVPILPG